MKKQDELRAQLARMKAEAEEKLKAGALEDAKAKVAEMDGIREQITLLDKLDADFADAVNTGCLELKRRRRSRTPSPGSPTPRDTALRPRPI